MNEHVMENEYRERLIQSLKKIFKAGFIEFYTDGSLIGRIQENMKMGVVWIQKAEPNVNNFFKCALSHHREQKAILMVLLTYQRIARLESARTVKLI